MASVTECKGIPRYTSGRLSPITAPEEAERELENASSTPGLRSDELPWMRLFHTDEVFRAFVNGLFCFSCAEEGETPPADHVLDQVLQLTPFARLLISHDWANPWITTDETGGVRLSWRRGLRELRAVIPADSKRERYIYWQEGHQYGAVPNFGSATLFTWLRWLNGQQNRELGA